MTSSVGVQYPQYPFFNAAPYYNYDDSTNSRGGNFHSHSIDEDTYPSSSGSSGYGDTAPSGYGPSHYPSTHPTGPTSEGHSAPVVHVPPSTKSFFANFKKVRSSTIGALTLLSFFFFINLLQTSLHEHTNDMNPTVMVMTNKFLRKNDKNNEMVEIISREHTSSPASTPSSTISEEIIVTNNIDISPSPSSLSSSSASTAAATIAATLNVVGYRKPTFEDVKIVNSNHNSNSNQISTDRIDSYDPNSFRNRTGNLSSPNKYAERYRPQHYYNDDYVSSYHGDGYRWSHYTPLSRYRNRFPDPYSSHWDDDARRFSNHDAYDRIY